MKCRVCGLLGHRQKNCAEYQCKVCRYWSPTHLSIYCPKRVGPPPFALTWKDEGFYDALRSWEQQLDDERIQAEKRRDSKRRAGLEEAEYMRSGSFADEDYEFSDDPIYYANQDE
jgi:hypothetical protein